MQPDLIGFLLKNPLLGVYLERWDKQGQNIHTQKSCQVKFRKLQGLFFKILNFFLAIKLGIQIIENTQIL